MKSPRTWMILGATSIIAEEFANLAAKAKQNLLLVGRNVQQLEIIAANIRLRYHVNCEILFTDFSGNIAPLLECLQNKSSELDLFIAHSMIPQNDELNLTVLEETVHTNVLSTLQLIHLYLQRTQLHHSIIFLSSVAACRGRRKNSLYGGTKAAIEIYLEGLQQMAKENVKITIVRLGFIDTVQTYGSPGIFYASPPKACAKACWQASKAGKRFMYHPFFWRYIMAIITHLPFFIFKRMKV